MEETFSDFLTKMLDSIGITQVAILEMSSICIKLETLFGISRDIWSDVLIEVLRTKFEIKREVG